jgi:SAM-dependent methyltransferase
VGGDERVRLWQAAPFLRETALGETFLNGMSLEGANALDVASGSGRESVWLALTGARVVGVDRLRDAVRNANRLGRQTLKALETRRDAGLDQPAQDVAPFIPPRWVEANVEKDWPFTGDTFDILLCFRFLWRPLFPTLVAALRPGGSLIYQSFTEKQREFGNPKRDIHLFKEGELRTRFEELGLETQFYEETCPPGGPAMASLWARKS